MTTMDPELEHYKRAIDLVEYAKKAGYEPRPEAVGLGLTVLDHPNRDRIVIARSPSGAWVYASVGDYAPGRPQESAPRALARLRPCIERATDKGSIVEFVQQRDWTARRREVPLERVRDCLRAYRATGVALDVEGALRPPPYGPLRDRSDLSGAVNHTVSGERNVAGHDTQLNRRRYDWTPPPAGAPRETEVEGRLRRWREAQATIEQKLQRSSQGQGRETLAVSPSALGRAGDLASLGPPSGPATGPSRGYERSDKPELARRRYDWTPAPAGIDAIRSKPRDRSQDRGR